MKIANDINNITIRINIRLDLFSFKSALKVTKLIPLTPKRRYRNNKEITKQLIVNFVWINPLKTQPNMNNKYIAFLITTISITLN